MRAEVLRVGKRIPEVARCGQLGMWIASYADADGSSSFPGRETLACLMGCSEETVTRIVKVLVGVGVIARKRRPNASSVYQLLPLAFLPGGLPWEEHIHHLTETRQRKAHAKKKAEAVAELTRTASMDAVRTGADAAEPAPDSVRGCVPDSVRGGGSEGVGGDVDSVHGRPRKASTDAVRTASVAGSYKVFPTCGRDPHTDKEPAGLVAQPQPRVGGRVEEGGVPRQVESGPALRPGGFEVENARCCPCGQRIVRADRELCGGCLRRQEAALHVQGAFLVSLTGGGQGVPHSRRERPEWPAEDPASPPRVCGCGRSHRLRDSDRCPDCVVAAEQQRLETEAVNSA
ncbi:helix-turn-helix domain-containing protein [Streptomyces goshikiensis]|uniref:helix-turn-helix domain-containing protein n=1 Tax=Streptomyces goshikiensis TaxID=1942 RepID=UPI003656A3C7